MKLLPKFWVIFVLACSLLHASETGLGPLTGAIRLPDSLQGRPIWMVKSLPNGDLALGFEGGIALGRPESTWRIVPSPGGQAIQTLAAGHDRILVAGSGFCGFLERDGLIPIAGMNGEYVSSEVIPEGWLVAGRDGVWQLDHQGVARRLSPPSVAGRQDRVIRIDGEIIVSMAGEAPQVWRGGALHAHPAYAGFADTQIPWAEGTYFVTNRGVLDREGVPVLPEDINRAALRAGLVGVADTGPWILTATFSEGLVAHDKTSGLPVWRWQEDIGDLYWFERAGDGFLIGGAQGAFSLADPHAHLRSPLHNELLLDLVLGDDGTVSAVTATDTLQLVEGGFTGTGSQWVERDGARIEEGFLHFNGNSVKLVTRFLYGLAVIGDTAAVCFDHGLTLISSDGTSREIPLEGIARGLATDGRNFLVATTTGGVHVVAPDGRLLRTLGSGRTAVSEVRPGKVVLLFWDGTLLDSDANLLGRIPTGNPRDAALVQDRLVVLVTRPDRDPVIGLMEGDTWQPLEMPGLAGIAAEQLAANATHVFAAGPRGLVRTRLPLPPSTPPRSDWRWAAPRDAREIRLPRSTQNFVSLSVGPGDLSPAPTTHFRLRTSEGDWQELSPGQSLQLPVSWGRTDVATQSERNGLVEEEVFTLVRPWPWWLRGWAWPLHAAALVGFVLGIARLRTRHLENRNRELQAHVTLRTEELHKANAVKEEFLASISHEIRNPLNGVVGICAMLADREVGSHEKLLVRTLGGCADQLRSMLDDILDFSHLERGTVALTNSSFEVRALVEESARVMDPELSACALIMPDHPVWLHGDSGKLRQITCNLVSNALKYGVPREAGIEVRTEHASGGGIRLRLAVRNTGPTIPAEDLPRLFESFHRGDHTTGIPGSGLGLAVCRRLAQSLGGRLTAASSEGVTEFALEVVLASSQPPAPVENALRPVSRALAIEDEDYNRLVLGHVLRAMGYSVDWAEDAAAALRLAASKPYDLVLTDWRLPDMEGDELCRRLLAIMPAPQPPVVAVTAYATAEKLAEARAAGMAGFVTKPVTREKLERIIRGLSTGQQPKRSLETDRSPTLRSPLASLGDLAPSSLRLAEDIAANWREVAAMAGLQDPRTASHAHALRSLLLMAGEDTAAEQVGLLEKAVDAHDWSAVQSLLPFAAEEVLAGETRLRA